MKHEAQVSSEADPTITPILQMGKLRLWVAKQGAELGFEL